MLRKMKVLGASALALFAVSAIAATAAHAATVSVTASSYPAILTGTQDGAENAKFIVGGGVRTVTCTNKTQLDATITGPADPLTVTPTYSSCHAAPNTLPVTVTLNGCDYSVTANSTSATTGNLTADLLCPAGKDIEVHLYENATKHAENKPLCSYTIKEQKGLAAGVYHNEPTDVTVTLEANPKTTVTVGSKILCGAAAGSEVASTLKGEYTLEGFKDENGVEGAAVNVSVD